MHSPASPTARSTGSQPRSWLSGSGHEVEDGVGLAFRHQDLAHGLEVGGPVVLGLARRAGPDQLGDALVLAVHVGTVPSLAPGSLAALVTGGVGVDHTVQH